MKTGTIRKVDLTGDYETTVYDAARRLLAEGADPADTVETWRGGKLSMFGVIGELAKWQVAFATAGPCLQRHKTRISACVAPEMPAPVREGPSSSRGRSMTARARSVSQGASRAKWAKRRQWRARLWVGDREVSLGYYDSPEAARRAHAVAAERFGLKLKGKMFHVEQIAAKLEERPG
jgi:flavin-binding protein dodecin